MKKLLLFVVLAVVLTVNLSAQDHETAVKDVVLSAYVNGIHNGGPIADIRAGFHPTFQMFRLNGNEIGVTTIDQWVAGIEAGRERNPNGPAVKSEANFVSVTVSGYSANVVLEVTRNGNMIFTDHLLLYQFEDGWKIVAKTFYSHPR